MTWDVARFVSADLETHLIQPGLLAPPIVCGSTAWWHEGRAAGTLLHREVYDPYLYARQVLAGCDCPVVFEGSRQQRRHGDWCKRRWQAPPIVVGANIAFDMVVLAAEAERRGDEEMLLFIVDAYLEQRVYDALIGSSLEAIADGTIEHFPSWDRRPHKKLQHPSGRITTRFSLEICTDICLGRADAKRNDLWRLRYAILDPVPLRDWPYEAKQYPVDDAVNTLEVAAAQVLGYLRPDGGYTPPHRNLDDMADQAFTAFWEQMGAVWGLRTDEDRVSAFGEKVRAAYERIVASFTQEGFFHTGTTWGPCGTCGRVECRDSGHARVVLQPCNCGLADCEKRGKKNPQAVKRAVALAYGVPEGATCAVCGGTGRAWGVSGNLTVCGSCDGTGLDLSTCANLPRTPSGGVSTDRDAIMQSGDERLTNFGDNEVVKFHDTYLPYVEKGVRIPITLSPNIILASGRSSYEELIQLFPRNPVRERVDGKLKEVMYKGLALGIRQCVRARDVYEEVEVPDDYVLAPGEEFVE